jgi:hypothetical protein
VRHQDTYGEQADAILSRPMIDGMSDNPQTRPQPPVSDPPPWELSDEKLLAEVRIDSYVASGPGGQKRHKTNAAVRMTHEPTRIVATATDSRSHREKPHPRTAKPPSQAGDGTAERHC